MTLAGKQHQTFIVNKMSWKVALRKTCRRRVLVFLIGVAVVAMFIQHQWITQTSLSRPEELFLASDWIRPNNHQVSSVHGTNRSGSQIGAASTENETITLPKLPKQRTASSSSAKGATPTPERIITAAQHDSDGDKWWAPPQLHTCHLQPNRTVTFAVPLRHVIIAGAQKSGTSALYFFLGKHPHFLAAKSVESHFFDWQYPYSPKETRRWMQERHLPIVDGVYLRCALRYEYFTQYFDGELLWERHLQNKTAITFEKTPAYLFLDKVPHRIYDVLSSDNLISTKIIVSLRHPVERAYSQFHSDRMFDQVPWNATFEHYLNNELGIMRRFGLSGAPNVPLGDGGGGGDKANNATAFPWNSPLFEIPKRVVQSSQSNSSAQASKWLDQAHWNVYRNTFLNNYLQRSMYASQLRRWMKFFPLNESLMVLPYEIFLDHPLDVVQEILHFCQVPMPDYFITHHVNASVEFKSVYYHHGGQKAPLSRLTRRYMERFLEPYNRDLAQLLHETRHDWSTIWKHHHPQSKVITPLKNHMLFPITPKQANRIQNRATQIFIPSN